MPRKEVYMSILKILIVDDELELRKSIKAVITSKINNKDIYFDEAADGAEAVAKVKEDHFDIVLMDVRMPKMNGLEALKLIKNYNSQTFIVIMTAHSNLQDAVTAIKDGAYDYLAKPVEPEQLSKIIFKAVETQEMVSHIALSKPIFADDVESELVGASEKMSVIYDLINRLSHVDTTVLIRGENGTGKELVAKAIHQNSPRKHEEFITINCEALAENMVESELFGHEKGAFPEALQRKIGKFQVATNGTIYLEEISALNTDLQSKLLRLLQERTFTPIGGTRQLKTNARIMASTSKNLEKMIEENTFRDDLFYKLNIMPIFLPPLRDRVEDIERLVRHFINLSNIENDKSISGVSKDALDCLKKYTWPGNINELQTCIERATLLTNGDNVELSDLPEDLINKSEERVNISLVKSYVGPLDYDTFKTGAEKEFIINALKANKGKINKTVAHANIPKNTLLRKIKKYNIDVKQFFEK